MNSLQMSAPPSVDWPQGRPPLWPGRLARGATPIALWCLLSAGFASEPIPSGPAQITVAAGGQQIDVFTYKPVGYRDGPLLIVCHGMLRNADEYRDNARGLADRLGAVVAAPRFDLERFPIEAYQLGGVFKKGDLQPGEAWTIALVPKIVEALRAREGQSDLPYCLIGHSAGAQFLSRLAGTMAVDCQRIVLANAGTHLFPTRDLPFPYGFGGLRGELGDDAALRRYVGQRVTIYLGTADLGDRNLPKSETAMKQGATRYERGKNCFQAARDLAQKNHWPFGWQLVEAPGIGHDSRAMFDHENAARALR